METLMELCISSSLDAYSTYKNIHTTDPLTDDQNITLPLNTNVFKQN